MPTCRPAPLLAALLLTGCVAAGGAATRSLAVAQGTVIVAGPPGYCVDRRLSRTGPGEAFVTLGNCAALSPGATGPAGVPAVLTATVSDRPATPPDPARLEAFLRSDAGRAALSRSGRAETVQILAARREGAMLLVQIRDGSAVGPGPATGPDYWRAVFDAGGRLVTASVLSFAGRPLDRDEGFRLLAAFAARIAAASAAPPA